MQDFTPLSEDFYPAEEAPASPAFVVCQTQFISSWQHLTPEKRLVQMEYPAGC